MLVALANASTNDVDRARLLARAEVTATDCEPGSRAQLLVAIAAVADSKNRPRILSNAESAAASLGPVLRAARLVAIAQASDDRDRREHVLAEAEAALTQATLLGAQRFETARTLGAVARARPPASVRARLETLTADLDRGPASGL